MAVIDTFQTALNDASTALSLRDYATARLKLSAAGIALAAIPNVGSDATSAQWRDDLARLRAELIDEESRAAGRRTRIQFAPITNVEPRA